MPLLNLLGGGYKSQFNFGYVKLLDTFG